MKRLQKMTVIFAILVLHCLEIVICTSVVTEVTEVKDNGTVSENENDPLLKTGNSTYAEKMHSDEDEEDSARDKRGFGGGGGSLGGKYGEEAGQKAVQEIYDNKRIALWSAQSAVSAAVGRNYLNELDNTAHFSAAFTFPVTKEQTHQAFEAVREQQHGAQISAAVAAASLLGGGGRGGHQRRPQGNHPQGPGRGHILEYAPPHHPPPTRQSPHSHGAPAGLRPQHVPPHQEVEEYHEQPSHSERRPHPLPPLPEYHESPYPERTRPHLSSLPPRFPNFHEFPPRHRIPSPPNRNRGHPAQGHDHNWPEPEHNSAGPQPPPFHHRPESQPEGHFEPEHRLPGPYRHRHPPQPENHYPPILDLSSIQDDLRALQQLNLHSEGHRESETERGNHGSSSQKYSARDPFLAPFKPSARDDHNQNLQYEDDLGNGERVPENSHHYDTDAEEIGRKSCNHQHKNHAAAHEQQQQHEGARPGHDSGRLKDYELEDGFLPVRHQQGNQPESAQHRDTSPFESQENYEEERAQNQPPYHPSPRREFREGPPISSSED